MRGINVKRVVFGVPLAAIVVLGCYMILTTYVFNDPDLPQSVAPRILTVPEQAPKQIPVVVQPSSPQVESVTLPTSSLPAVHETASSATSRQLTELRAALEVRQAQLDLLEVEKKIDTLSQPPAPVIIQPVMTPAATPATDQARRPATSSLPRVVSIAGMDDALTAVLMTSAGRQTVRKGDRVGAGRVENISPDGVMLQVAGKTQSLPFED
jgi:type IV pilus biogenesis protein PilP